MAYPRKQQRWIIENGGVLFSPVEMDFDEGMDAPAVKRALIADHGMPLSITVRKVQSNRIREEHPFVHTGRHRLRAKSLARSLHGLASEFETATIGELREGLERATKRAEQLEDEAIAFDELVVERALDSMLGDDDPDGILLLIRSRGVPIMPPVRFDPQLQDHADFRDVTGRIVCTITSVDEGRGLSIDVEPPLDDLVTAKGMEALKDEPSLEGI